MVQTKIVNKVLIVTGATATGKTDIAIGLAQKLNAEIISADSMQIYRKMDIGTAKPTQCQQSLIKHHLIDIVDPKDDYNVDRYVQSAIQLIGDIQKRDKNVIIAGGTGFYINSLLYPLEFDVNPEIRLELTEYLHHNGAALLYDRLKEVDPASAEAIHPNNIRRVIRALEIFYTTGTAKSQGKRTEFKPRFNNVIVQLVKDRAKLYENINLRVDKMIEQGLIEEVKQLNGQLGLTAGQAIGYKELTNYLSGRESLEKAIDLIKQRSRNYAKRQTTYLSRMQTALVNNYENNAIEQIMDIYYK